MKIEINYYNQHLSKKKDQKAKEWKLINKKIHGLMILIVLNKNNRPEFLVKIRA